MKKLKVLVVDDSALFRTLLRNSLHEIPDCEIVGTASDGKTALAKIMELQPDLVTLDVEMPDMDGIAVLRKLKREHQRCKVLMVSRLTAAGTQVTTDALFQGAFDFILKPCGKDPHANRIELQNSLAEKVAMIRDAMGGEREASSLVIANSTAKRQRVVPFKAVVIGCSTGGPDALAQVIPYLSDDFPVPILIAQHMPPHFTASLATRLNEASEINVYEASDGLRLQKGVAVIAHGGKHMKLERSDVNHIITRLTEDAAEHNCRPAVDYVLRSAVEVFQGPILAVILTGMGRDGTEGCRLVRQVGGEVIAQDPNGCVVFGMPKSVISSGQADQVIPLPKIASMIEQTVHRQT